MISDSSCRLVANDNEPEFDAWASPDDCDRRCSRGCCSSIRNPVFATMVMVALVVLGLFSYAGLGVEQMPNVQIPVVFIQVQYPGAPPEAV